MTGPEDARQALDAARPDALRALKRLAVHGRTARVRAQALRSLENAVRRPLAAEPGPAGVLTPAGPSERAEARQA